MAITIQYNGPQNPQNPAANWLYDEGFDRVMRWYTHYKGTGRDESLAVRSQQYTCSITNLGPGLMSSAEIPHTVEVFDHKPNEGDQPAETFAGTFHIYYIPAGMNNRATTAITTQWFPFVKIRLGTPAIYDVAGRIVTEPPNAHMSRTTFDVDNVAVWDYFVAQRQATAPQDPPLEGAGVT